MLGSLRRDRSVGRVDGPLLEYGDHQQSRGRRDDHDDGFGVDESVSDAVGSRLSRRLGWDTSVQRLESEVGDGRGHGLGVGGGVGDEVGLGVVFVIGDGVGHGVGAGVGLGVGDGLGFGAGDVGLTWARRSEMESGSAQVTVSVTVAASATGSGCQSVLGLTTVSAAVLAPGSGLGSEMGSGSV